MKNKKRKQQKNPQIGNAYIFDNDYRILDTDITFTVDRNVIIRFYTAEKIKGKNHFDVVLSGNSFIQLERKILNLKNNIAKYYPSLNRD